MGDDTLIKQMETEYNIVIDKLYLADKKIEKLEKKLENYTIAIEDLSTANEFHIKNNR